MFNFKTIVVTMMYLFFVTMFITNLFIKFDYKDLLTSAEFHVAAFAIDFSRFYIK